MGKTHNDEEYEKGVRDGQEGGFLDDLIQSFTRSGSIRDKGYDYGAEHRYGPNGQRYRGGIGPKIKETGKSTPSSLRYSSVESPHEQDINSQIEERNEEDEDYIGDDYEQDEQADEEYHPKDEKEEKEEIKPFLRGRLYVSEYTNHKELERLVKNNEIFLYSGVTFIPPDYLVTYKCDRCDHEWDEVIPETFLSSKNFIDCRMGCSSGADKPSLLGFCKIIKGLITGKQPFGYGRLIKSKKLPGWRPRELQSFKES